MSYLLSKLVWLLRRKREVGYNTCFPLSYFLQPVLARKIVGIMQFSICLPLS